SYTWLISPYSRMPSSGVPDTPGSVAGPGAATAATTEPPATPASRSPARDPCAPNRASARGASTALDSHGPGCNAAPISSATEPGVSGTPDDGMRLYGEISQVYDAGAADVLLVAAGDTLHAVPTASPLVDITANPGIDQSRKAFRVVFDGAPAEVLAHADRRAAEALVDDMIVAWAADAVGAARQVLQLTVDHAKVRRQFGAPIGSFQAVAHLCVDMYETVELARSGVLYALWAADSADHRDRHLAALRVKGFAGRLAAVGDLAIQVFGGIGFTWEHDAQLYLKRLLSFSRFLGSPGHYLEQIGQQLTRSAS
ncbi:acyl-CoA dehydrogenase family protein, partial [Mycobacterium sp. GA-1841]|uniref:acyl-CoA dehydrogenase family protein n=1 Tax=Mycobacterium sp. GA-1841 TaxID=1834154 RepID=UPI00352DDD76